MILVLFSFALRIFLANFFLNKGSIECWEYDDIARNIISGKGFTILHLGTEYKSFTTPLFILLLALIYKAFGLIMAPVILIQIALSILTCIIVFLIAKEVSDDRIAMVAFVLTLFHPALILYSVQKIHSLTLDAFMFSLVILFIMKLRENQSFKNMAFVGFLFGITALSRFSILDFLPFVFVWLFFILKGRFTNKILHMLVLFIFVILPVSGWTMRNYMVHGKFIPSATVDAEVFWRGNNANATGSSYQASGNPVLLADRALYLKVISLKELEQREAFRKEAMNFVRKNPDKFIDLFFKKLFYFWWRSPTTGMLYPSSYTIVYGYLYYIYAFFAILGFYKILIKKISVRTVNFVLLILFLFSISIFQSFFYVEGRHRWAVEPIFLIISAIGMISFSDSVCKLFKERF